MDYLSLSDASSHQTTLMSLLRCDSPSDVGRLVIDATKRAHQCRSRARHYDITGYLPPKSRRFLTIVRSLVHCPGDLHYSLTSESLAQQLRARFDSKESGIWGFFANPDIVTEASKVAGEAVDIGGVDLIVGTGYLGTFLSLCLAWHNKFTGRILSTVSPVGWDKLDGAVINRCLVCSARLCTGYYTLGAIRLLSEHGLSPEGILVLRLYTEGVRFPRSRALSTLCELGIEVLALS